MISYYKRSSWNPEFLHLIKLNPNSKYYKKEIMKALTNDTRHYSYKLSPLFTELLKKTLSKREYNYYCWNNSVSHKILNKLINFFKLKQDNNEEYDMITFKDEGNKLYALTI